MSKLIGNSLDFNNASRILNLPAPASNNEPARLADLNSAIEGLAFKDSSRVSTQSNLNIASPGASIDGITMASGDRVLVRAQTAQAENGIYIWNGAATPMTRALDASTSAELEQAVTTVEEGTSAGASYRQTSVNFTIDSGAVAWTAFGTAAGAASETTSGIAELATQAEVDAGTDDLRIVTPLKLMNFASRVRKYATTFGDGSSTSYTITHNLNTKNVIVRVYYTGGTFDEIECDVLHATANTVTLVFLTAPTSNQFTVVVIG